MFLVGQRAQDAQFDQGVQSAQGAQSAQEAQSSKKAQRVQTKLAHESAEEIFPYLPISFRRHNEEEGGPSS